jgi:hypothetical protein
VADLQSLAKNMSLLAEEVVEEWLRTKGFFTVRGAKEGVSELDLLGIKGDVSGQEAWHVEVQVSLNPIGHISRLRRERDGLLTVQRSRAGRRTKEELEQSVEDWVYEKFETPHRRSMRRGFWAGIEWKYVFIHGVVRNSEELELIGKRVHLVPFNQVLADLLVRRGAPQFFPNAHGHSITEILHHLTDAAKKA